MVSEMSTVTIDEKGRIVLPAWVRKKFKGKKVVVHEEETNRIVIESVMTTDEAFGSLKGKLDIEGFRKEHEKER